MSSKDLSESATASEAVPAKPVDQRLVDELVGRAQAERVQLIGEGGLLQQLTKRLLESALEGEITDHLGYDSTTRPVGAPVTPGTGPGPRPC